MRVLLVSPPRRIWPYIDYQDNFLLPQWMVSLAAVLREDGVEVHALDCMAGQVGWRTLEQKLRRLRPDVVASGENHALFASEVIRLLALAKAIDPATVTVAGGAHFTTVPELYLPHHPVDLIVRGEGEITLLEVVRSLATGGLDAAREVDGVASWDGGRLRCAPPRELVQDLDTLPMPAYDLLPLERYGRGRYLFSPGGATIQHSRGCTGSCTFCAWWRQMADRRPCAEGGPERLVPRWRTKSVERTLAEMELLHLRHGKRCLVFVDPSFNIDPRWNDAFATRLLRKGWDLSWFAFMRADLILRDEELGIFEKLVRSGLTHLCVGVERQDDAQLRAWGKPPARSDQYLAAFRLLRRRYPQVFRQATFIVGTRSESHASLRQQLRYARQIRADYPAFHPVTPFPGTELYDEALARGELCVPEDFESLDMMTALLPTDHLSRDEVEQALVDLNRACVGPRWLLRGLLSRSRYRRHMYTWWLLVTGRIFLDSVRRRLNPLRPERYTSTITPRWYES